MCAMLAIKLAATDTNARTQLYVGSGEVVLPTDIVEEVLSAHDDLFVVPGPAPRTTQRPAPQSASATPCGSNGDGGGGLRCRNYGCNATFTEAENSDTACRFHTAPPVFHDTKKGWSCCPKRVYDWDEFHLVRPTRASRLALVRTDPCMYVHLIASPHPRTTGSPI